MNDLVRELGIDVTNDFELPKVRVTRPAIIDGRQFFRLETERQYLDLYITPKGYIVAEKPQSRLKPYKPRRRRDG